MKCLANSTQPQPLSPVWEAFNTGILQPAFKRLLEVGEGTGSQPADAKRMRDLERCVALHPLNMSDAKVNTTRANSFLLSLGVHLQSHRLPGLPGKTKPWWHMSAEKIIEMVKKEREEIETLGYIVGFGGRKEDVGATCASIAGEKGETTSEGSSTLKRKHAE